MTDVERQQALSEASTKELVNELRKREGVALNLLILELRKGLQSSSE